MEARPWQPFSYLLDRFSPESSADPVDAPWLVVQLAQSVLKRLQEEASPGSSADSSAEMEDLRDLVAAAGGKLLPTATSESPSPLPTPSARKQLKTSSSNGSEAADDELYIDIKGHTREDED